MRVELDMPVGLEDELKALILNATKQALDQSQKQQITKQWLSLKEGASYAGVSYNSFIKFREMGLKVCEIDGIKRVSKKEIDQFLYSFSF